jgi:2-polyprenyl-6-methoxyphenol hydroxylase-like FAD-dependent oxidoreductase
MGSTIDADVVVVGAGPTGLTLGAVLAAAGARSLVIDAQPGPERESSRATTVHAGTLEALDERLDGLGAEVAARGHAARRSVLWHGRQRIASVHWDRMPTRYAAMVNLPQTDTEALLRGRLERYGGTVRWGWQARSVDQHDDHVSVRMARGDDEQSVHARYVAGCDGAHSEVRRSCGIALTGTTYPERFLLADVDLDTDLGRDLTHVFVSTRGVLGVMPMPSAYRLNGTLGRGEQLTPTTLAGLMRARLGRAADRVRLRSVMWAAEYRTHSRLADAYRSGRVFLAGDAAHLNSPVGGQGMNVGIADALDLGRGLAAAVAATPDEASLDGYEARRRPVAAEVLRRTRTSTRMIAARNPVERLVRDQLMRLIHRLPPVQRRLTLEPAGLA